MSKLRALQARDRVAIRARDLTRTHLERLLRSGVLLEVMKGWFIPARPDGRAGDSSAWFASFWGFVAEYLKARFGRHWSLSPEQSLLLHGGNRSVPEQLVVRSPTARNRVTTLRHNTSLLEVRASLPAPRERQVRDGLRLFSLSSALIASSPSIFTTHPTDTRTALSTITEASDILRGLLDHGHSVVAGRLAGAFRNIGRDGLADEVIRTMTAAGYTVREQDPFDERIELQLPARELSPHAGRIRLMWQRMRDQVRQRFPRPPGIPRSAGRYVESVEEAYLTDAYHSLSIEGFRVGSDLIQRVQSGAWNPQAEEKDQKLEDALAARGYWQAFQAVERSVKRVLAKDNPGTVAERDHAEWYREMFAPRVAAGLVPAASLAGYRDGQVYIRGSRHVPLSPDAVSDAMQVLFELLAQEREASVRVVLGHFVFVYIHPYMDGNGRIGRFLMNLMLASGGYPWTVVPLQERGAYMEALESASVHQNIVPLAQLLARLVRDRAEGKTVGGGPEVELVRISRAARRRTSHASNRGSRPPRR